MYDRLYRQFYGPFSEPSSILKGHPITIIDSTALAVRQNGEHGKKDTSFPPFKSEFTYNKDGDCILIANDGIFDKNKKGLTALTTKIGLFGTEKNITL